MSEEIKKKKKSKWGGKAGADHTVILYCNSRNLSMGRGYPQGEVPMGEWGQPFYLDKSFVFI